MQEGGINLCHVHLNCMIWIVVTESHSDKQRMPNLINFHLLSDVDHPSSPQLGQKQRVIALTTTPFVCVLGEVLLWIKMVTHEKQIWNSIKYRKTNNQQTWIVTFQSSCTISWISRFFFHFLHEQFPPNFPEIHQLERDSSYLPNNNDVVFWHLKLVHMCKNWILIKLCTNFGKIVTILF